MNKISYNDTLKIIIFSTIYGILLSITTILIQTLETYILIPAPSILLHKTLGFTKSVSTYALIKAVLNLIIFYFTFKFCLRESITRKYKNLTMHISGNFPYLKLFIFTILIALIFSASVLIAFPQIIHYFNEMNNVNVKMFALCAVSYMITLKLIIDIPIYRWFINRCIKDGRIKILSNNEVEEDISITSKTGFALRFLKIAAIVSVVKIVISIVTRLITS